VVASRVAAAIQVAADSPVAEAVEVIADNSPRFDCTFLK
jgi:hypothetical protein